MVVVSSTTRIAFSLAVTKINFEIWFENTDLLQSSLCNRSRTLKHKSHEEHRNAKHITSVFVWIFPFFRFVFHQKPMALRPSCSTAENLPEESRLLYPRGRRQENTKTHDLWIKWRCSSSPSPRPRFSPSSSIGFTKRKWFVMSWGSRAISIGTCTESTIPTEGQKLSPLDWNLIFYTEIEL